MWSTTLSSWTLKWMKTGRHKKHFGSALHVSPYCQKWERFYSHGNAIIKILQLVYVLNKVLQNRGDEARDYVPKTPA